MTDYDFRALSPVDFEQFARDLLNADLGLRLHSYAAGRDQGIDLRGLETDGRIVVVQCKHYPDSSDSAFRDAVEKEGKRGADLQVDRYLFVTSRRLTPNLQQKIVELLDGLPVALDDVWGQNDLNGALVRCPEIERRYIKLWLRSAEVLQAIIANGQWQRSQALLEDLADRTQRWVHIPAYDDVLAMLEREGVCIITGPPGVGKSFLAEMALVALARDGWQVVDVGDSIEDAWQALRSDESRQVFFYDDFLGSAGLDVAKGEPSSLNLFLARMRQLRATKRAILTTKTQILNLAADGPADKLADIARHPARFSLALDGYDPEIRARILFNQLYYAGLGPEERQLLALDNRLITIAQHSSYNPRLIAQAIRFASALTADELVTTIGHFLDNPAEVWQASFRGLPALAQEILLMLVSLPNRPWPADAVLELVAPPDVLAWRPALRSLESTWLRLWEEEGGPYLAFANAGCYDFLLGLIDDPAVAGQLVERARLLPQLANLARVAGLVPSPDRPLAAVRRPELARALTDRRSQVLAEARHLAEAPSAATGRIATLTEAADLLAALGRAEDTAWLVDQVDQLMTGGLAGAAPPVAAIFRVAGTLSRLPADDLDWQRAVVLRLALLGTAHMQTIRDLDAYEALPVELLTDQALVSTGQAVAASILEAEYDYLLHASADGEAIEAEARDLAERARRYRLDLDIGPILDHVDQLGHDQDRRADQADLTDRQDADPDEPEANLQDIFRQFAADGPEA